MNPMSKKFNLLIQLLHLPTQIPQRLDMDILTESKVPCSLLKEGGNLLLPRVTAGRRLSIKASSGLSGCPQAKIAVDRKLHHSMDLTCFCTQDWKNSWENCELLHLRAHLNQGLPGHHHYVWINLWALSRVIKMSSPGLSKINLTLNFIWNND